MTSVRGRVSARVRGRLASCIRWDALAVLAADRPPRGGGVGTWSAFAVLGVATLTALGLAAAGIDSVVPATARNAQAASTEVAAEGLPAAAPSSVPAGAATHLTVSRTYGQESRVFSPGRTPGQDGPVLSPFRTPGELGLLFVLPEAPGRAGMVFPVPESPLRDAPVVARPETPSRAGLIFALPETPSRAAPVAAQPEPLPRVRQTFALPEVPPREDQRALARVRAEAPAPEPPAQRAKVAWREARALSDQPVAVVARPATPVAIPEPPAREAAPVEPVPKPDVMARTGSADAPPPVVYKPRVTAAATPPAAGARREGRALPTVAAVTARFDLAGYDLSAVRNAVAPVPRVYLQALPHGLSELTSVAAKKRLFVQAILPIILKVNEEIAAARWRVQRLGSRLMWADSVAPADRQWLERMAERYGTEPFDIPSLLVRMDVVPPSLGLAQAALESGWGTSRFVREGNALFGQYTYKSVMGMMPERRDEDRRHRVRRHDTLLASVQSYVHNLNTHVAYEDFRERRARLRSAGRLIGGYDLAGQLEAYSERRAAYIEDIRRVIRQNGLSDFDRAWLNDRQWTAAIRPSSEEPI